jgi:hypothetical protein
MNTPKSAKHQFSSTHGGLCVTWACTSQGWTALIRAANEGKTGCVQALVAAKASLEITSVSVARLFACPVTLESPSTSKWHKHLLKVVSCAVVCLSVCVCVCVCVYEQWFRYCRLYLVIVRSFCVCTHTKLIMWFGISQADNFRLAVIGVINFIRVIRIVGLVRLLFS